MTASAVGQQEPIHYQAREGYDEPTTCGKTDQPKPAGDWPVVTCAACLSRRHLVEAGFKPWLWPLAWDAQWPEVGSRWLVRIWNEEHVVARVVNDAGVPLFVCDDGTTWRLGAFNDGAIVRSPSGGGGS
jgi:hypothetical protein